MDTTGDTDALFGACVAQHHERLFRFVLRRIGHVGHVGHVGHRAEADDLAQQSFVEAMLAYRSARGDAQLATWLYAIAVNLMRNHLRREAPPPPHSGGAAALDALACDRAGPDHQCALTQRLDMLTAELAGLPPDLRDVLLLVALNALPYDATAGLLALPVGTVRSRVAQARAQLRCSVVRRGHDTVRRSDAQPA